MCSGIRNAFLSLPVNAGREKKKRNEKGFLTFLIHPLVRSSNQCRFSRSPANNTCTIDGWNIR